MPWTPPVDPIAGTVITVAYFVANALNPIRWLRTMTGGSDPPGSNYLVTSDSVSATSWKTGPTAISNVLGYTPLKNTTDTFTGTLTATGFQAGASGVNGGGGGVAGGSGGFQGGSLTAGGTVNVQGLATGALGIAAGAGGVNAGSGQGYSGGTTAAGSGIPSMLGVNVGTSGISITGPIISTSTGSFGGTVSATGNMSSSGVVSGNTFSSSVALGTAPFACTSTTVCANLNADRVDGAHASATPTADMIPIADGTGRLAAGWLPASSVAGVPTGLVAAFDSAAHLTAAGAGWARHTSANGLLLIGDTPSGAVLGQTFTAGTFYGATGWAHLHTDGTHNHGPGGMSVSGTTGNNSATGQAAGTGTNRADSPHTHTFGASVSGSTDTSGANIQNQTWIPPTLAVVWAIKL